MMTLTTGDAGQQQDLDGTGDPVNLISSSSGGWLAYGCLLNIFLPPSRLRNDPAGLGPCHHSLAVRTAPAETKLTATRAKGPRRMALLRQSKVRRLAVVPDLQAAGSIVTEPV